MNYYWFNRREILQIAKEKYSKKKSSRVLCTKQRSYKKKVKRALKKLVTRKKKTRLKIINEKNIKNWFNIKKKR